MRIFIEATGSLVSNSLIKSIRECGHICVASDASKDSIGKYLADEFYQVPFASDDSYSDFVKKLLIDKKIDMVIPTLDDALIKWDSIRNILNENGITLALSSFQTLQICQDKWETYKFFDKNHIPTPKTSLEQEFGLVKPRNGRGGSGVKITDEKVNMDGMISQEVLEGVEYTVDVFCSLNHEPIYIVPRKRIGIKEGKSTGGIVVDRSDIADYVKLICKSVQFVGAVNIQCFDTTSGIKFTEINPRFGGATILGMKATENWIPLSIRTFLNKEVVKASFPVKYGLKMGRYYSEVFYE